MTKVLKLPFIALTLLSTLNTLSAEKAGDDWAPPAANKAETSPTGIDALIGGYPVGERGKYHSTGIAIYKMLGTTGVGILLSGVRDAKTAQLLSDMEELRETHSKIYGPTGLESTNQQYASALEGKIKASGLGPYIFPEGYKANSTEKFLLKQLNDSIKAKSTEESKLLVLNDKIKAGHLDIQKDIEAGKIKIASPKGAFDRDGKLTKAGLEIIQEQRYKGVRISGGLLAALGLLELGADVTNAFMLNEGAGEIPLSAIGRAAANAPENVMSLLGHGKKINNTENSKTKEEEQ